MHLSLVAALARSNHVIGDGQRMPWHLPGDLKRFRRLTLHKPVIMGRRTYDSLGRPLPDRPNIVLTRSPDFAPAGVLVAHSPDEALALAASHAAKPHGEAVVIGGAEVYRLFADRVDRLYLTFVEGEFEGSVVFPYAEVTAGDWRVESEEVIEPDGANVHGQRFVVMSREA